MVAHTQRAHARLAPSAAKRWLNCPGSIRLTAHIPNTSSVHADEGTAAHTLAERCLARGFDTDMWLGYWIDLNAEHDGLSIMPKKVGEGRWHEITTEMAEAVQVYLETVREVAHAHDEMEHEVEVFLDLSHLKQPGLDGGTGDFVAYDPRTKRLTIADLKYGKGVVVDPKENEQLLTYAVGVVKRYHNRGVAEVELIIVQPRAMGAPVKRWVTDAMDLMAFQARLVSGAKATQADDAPLAAGEWCKFCPAAGTCPKQREAIEEAASIEFDTPAGLDLGTLADAYRRLPQVEAWCKRVKDAAQTEAKAGRLMPGYKLVAGRSTRRWSDPAAAKGALLLEGLKADEIMSEPELLSVAQVEKLVPKAGRGFLADLIVKSEGAATLAPLDDPRPALVSDAAAEFGAV